MQKLGLEEKEAERPSERLPGTARFGSVTPEAPRPRARDSQLGRGGFPVTADRRQDRNGKRWPSSSDSRATPVKIPLATLPCGRASDRGGLCSAISPELIRRRVDSRMTHSYASIFRSEISRSAAGKKKISHRHPTPGSPFLTTSPVYAPFTRPGSLVAVGMPLVSYG